jgi:hypothetical protein
VIPRRRLSADNPEPTTITLALFPQYVRDWTYKTRNNPDGVKLLGYYWGPANGRTGSDGQVSGPGFVADAKDFPPGTRLTVTARVELPNTEEATGEWQHGDVVLDARGQIFTRASSHDVAQGWPWASGADTTFAHGMPYAAEGGRSEDAPVRPLTLLVRNGQRWTG